MNHFSYGWKQEISEPEFIKQEASKAEVSINIRL